MTSEYEMSALPERSEAHLLSVVIPVFNEEESLPMLFERLESMRQDVDLDVEFLLINDGSRDESLVVMLEKARQDESYVVVDLSRNFGHQRAVSAGLSLAKGDVVAIMDADCQDPPELIAPMVEKWKEGADVVYGRRVVRQGESFFKKASAYVFYRLLGAMSDSEMPNDTGDFRVLDRRVVDALVAMPEQHRYLRGMIAWLGFKQLEFPYERQTRVAGNTKYPLTKMMSLAVDALFSFSIKPLRWITITGGIMTGLSFLMAIALGIVWLIMRENFQPGIATIMVSLWFLFGLSFLFLGVLGEYVGRTFVNAQGRPLFLIRNIYARKHGGYGITHVSEGNDGEG